MLLIFATYTKFNYYLIVSNEYLLVSQVVHDLYMYLMNRVHPWPTIFDSGLRSFVGLNKMMETRDQQDSNACRLTSFLIELDCLVHKPTKDMLLREKRRLLEPRNLKL